MRVSQSIDSVKEKYLKYESTKDEYASRIVSELNQLSTNFTISLLYFNFKHITNTMEVIEIRKKIEN